MERGKILEMDVGTITWPWNHDLETNNPQRTRTEIMDTLYFEIDNKDWLNPVTANTVDAKFIEKAQNIFTEQNSWVLAGNWLEERSDIVAWLRSSYWKYNKKRITNKSYDPWFLYAWGSS